ncbi:MAG: DsbE family thiol:disulfide interchange protein [Alphaproteobacteria bacterium]|nr:DsbE family thiol:disulfide interchange protein [Alphaproteobacteria bacterium]MDE2336763.1 DsbE family thiol:disulfide interchange protein [Alphaproteobacteria bacterium]
MKRFLPLIIFLALAGIFYWRIVLIDRGDMPSDIPSVMIGKPAPVFDLPNLDKGRKPFTAADLKGRVTLLGFFASWCVDCGIEHPYLSLLKGHGAALVGVDYEDKSAAARAWLEKHGNPYDAVVTDARGRTGIDFGLYGVPETYIIDRQGIIRYKQTGPMTPDVIRKTILPLVARLEK